MAKSWVYIILAAVAGMIFTTFLSEIVFSNQYEAKKYLSEMQSASGAQTASYYQESRMKTGTNGSVEDIGLYEGAEADLLRVFAYHNKTITKVFYNRVPKCGSTTVTSVIGSVAKRNKLNHHVSGLWTIIHLYTEDKKKRFIREFNWQKKPLVYDRHFHFFDFTKFGEEQPVYINVLRDPLESFVSRWYFNTRPGGWKSKQNKYATFDDCMAANCSEVTKHGASIISNMAYICGHDPVCITGSDASVAVTKQNVMKHFSVIGLTEELEGFFELLDYLHPNIFKGVNQEYKNRVSKAKSVRNKGKNKKPLKPVTVNRMMALLKYEYEVYHFIKQRYYLMYDRLQKLKQS